MFTSVSGFSSSGEKTPSLLASRPCPAMAEYISSKVQAWRTPVIWRLASRMISERTVAQT
jgi:hypothetical protein